MRHKEITRKTCLLNDLQLTSELQKVRKNTDINSELAKIAQKVCRKMFFKNGQRSAKRNKNGQRFLKLYIKPKI